MVAITAPAVKGVTPTFVNTGYSVAISNTAKLEALGTTRDNKLPNKNITGTITYFDLIFPNGFVIISTVTSFAPIKFI